MPATIVITCPECKKQIKGPPELRGKKIRCKSCGHTFAVPGGPGAKPGPAAVPKSSSPGKPAPAAKGGKPPPPPAPAKDEDDDDGSEAYAVLTDDANKPAPPPKKTAPAPPPPAAKSSRARNPEDEVAKNPYGVTTLDLTPRCPHCAQALDSEDSVICLNCGYNTLTREMGKTVHAYAHTPMERFMWLLPGIGCFLACLALLFFVAWLWLWMHGMAEKDPSAWWTTFDALPTQIYGSVVAGILTWIAGKFAIKRLIKNFRPPEKIKG